MATGQRLGIARGLEAFAALAVVRGDDVTAVRLEGAATALREVVGQVRSAAAQARLDAPARGSSPPARAERAEPARRGQAARHARGRQVRPRLRSRGWADGQDARAQPGQPAPAAQIRASRRGWQAGQCGRPVGADRQSGPAAGSWRRPGQAVGTHGQGAADRPADRARAVEPRHRARNWSSARPPRRGTSPTSWPSSGSTPAPRSPPGRPSSGLHTDAQNPCTCAARSHDADGQADAVYIVRQRCEMHSGMGNSADAVLPSLFLNVVAGTPGHWVAGHRRGMAGLPLTCACSGSRAAARARRPACLPLSGARCRAARIHNRLHIPDDAHADRRAAYGL